MIVLSFSVSAKVIDGTRAEVEIDQVAYERIFLTCLSTFKVDSKKDSESLKEVIESCQVSAQKIAARSEYVGQDDKYYITIKPQVNRSSGDDVKQIKPTNE